MQHAWLLTWLCLCSCVSAPSSRRPPPGARSPTWSCVLHEGRVACSSATGARPLEVPFLVRAVAARPRGGAYVLGAGGLLARYSARGVLSGVVQTPLRTLVTSHDFVCGLDAEGWMSCARDSSQDRVCAASNIGTFARVGGSPLRELSSDLATDRFCLLDHAGRRTCASARAPCDRSCIAFPACSRPRCIDPCPRPSEPARPGVTGLDFFSSATAPTATYPE